jgi:hypothetical protein
MNGRGFGVVLLIVAQLHANLAYCEGIAKKFRGVSSFCRPEAGSMWIGLHSPRSFILN